MTVSSSSAAVPPDVEHCFEQNCHELDCICEDEVCKDESCCSSEGEDDCEECAVEECDECDYPVIEDRNHRVNSTSLSGSSRLKRSSKNENSQSLLLENRPNTPQSSAARFEELFQPRMSNSRDIPPAAKRARLGSFKSEEQSTRSLRDQIQEHEQEQLQDNLQVHEHLLYCHWDSHHEEDDQVKFDNPSDLDHHLRTSHLMTQEEAAAADDEMSKYLACHWDSCYQSAKEVDDLMSHIKSSHLSNSTQPHIDCQVAPPTSTSANSTSTSSATSKQQSVAMTPDQILACHWDNCNFMASDSQTLDSHIQRHALSSSSSSSNHAAQSAEACASFTDNNQEQSPPQHINPYMCEFNSCSYKSVNYSDLMSHVRNQHPSSSPAFHDHHFHRHHHHHHHNNSPLSQPPPQLTSSASSTSSSLVSTPSEVLDASDLCNSHHHHHHHHPHHNHLDHLDHDHDSCNTHQTQLPSPPVSVDDSTCKWVMEDGSLCNKVYSCPLDLSNHIVDHHIGSRKSTYTCMWHGCERKCRPFPQRQKIIRHLQTHSKNKPFKCHVCQASFAEESVLKQHLRVHSGERPYECKICHKRFAASTALSVHLRTHTGEKPLVCKFEGCGKRFSESSNLAKHMKTHYRNEIVCKVDGCDKKFSRSDQLSKHMRAVHDIF